MADIGRPLQTALPWAYLGASRLLAVSWDACERTAPGARIVAVAPMAAAGVQPIGVSLCCVAVTVGLAAGLSLEAIAAACAVADARLGEQAAPVTAAGSIGSLARHLHAAETNGGAQAARYALDCRPGGEAAPDPEPGDAA